MGEVLAKKKKTVRKKKTVKKSIKKVKKAKKNPDINKRGKGRPTKLTHDTRISIMQLARAGKTNEEMAAIVGIAEKTFYQWKNNNEDFCKVLENNKAAADKMVEAAVFQRAMGYTIEEEKIHFDQFGDVSRATTHKHYPSDPTSANFWLTNRNKKKWKNKQEVELGEETRRDFKLSYNLDD